VHGTCLSVYGLATATIRCGRRTGIWTAETVDLCQVARKRRPLKFLSSKARITRGWTVENNNISSDWAERLRLNRPTFNQLTLRDVARMSAGREIDGWYVARHDGKWTIGRRSQHGYYPVMLGAEALTFDSKEVAERYLRALLAPTGVEMDSSVRHGVDIVEAALEHN
jgi:hypothetical protein